MEDSQPAYAAAAAESRPLMMTEEEEADRAGHGCAGPLAASSTGRKRLTTDANQRHDLPLMLSSNTEDHSAGDRDVPNAKHPSAVSTSRMLTDKQVAVILNVSVRTLATWRQQQCRPPFWKVLHGRIVRYPSALLYAWIDTESTNDVAPRRRRATRRAIIASPPSSTITASPTAGIQDRRFRAKRQSKTIVERAILERQRAYAQSQAHGGPA